ncbi:MAG TPA: hypothetical protein VM307_06720 [Egibacteraceae bacterium]|nr:hypothetical protein [Egibacteraceae bacterium]
MTAGRRTWVVALWSAAVVVLLVAGLLVEPLGPRADRLDPTNWFTTLGLIGITLLMAALSALLLIRQPRNRMGWVFAALVSIMGLAYFLDTYSVVSFTTGLPPLPGATAVAWVNMWLPPGLWLVINLLLLLFPDGRLPSRRWRPVALLQAVFYGASMLLWALRPGPMGEGGTHNPVGIAALRGIDDAFGTVFWLVSTVLSVISAASLIFRYRSARDIRRQQLKWLALSGLFIVTGGVTLMIAGAASNADGVIDHPVANAAGLMLAGGFVSVPFFAALAILRYRLYEIDRIISRTVTYALLTGVLLAVYIGGVAVVSPVAASLGGDSNLAVAAATLAVAAAFQPVRRRVQQVVDRRFNRAAYDADRTVRAFAERLREPVDVADVAADLAATATDVVAPACAVVWVAPGTSRS